MEADPVFLFSCRDSYSAFRKWECNTHGGRNEDAGLGRQANQGQLKSEEVAQSTVEPKGGFPLSRKFYVRMDVHWAGFTYVNTIRNDV